MLKKVLCAVGAGGLLLAASQPAAAATLFALTAWGELANPTHARTESLTSATQADGGVLDGRTVAASASAISGPSGVTLHAGATADGTAVAGSTFVVGTALAGLSDTLVINSPTSSGAGVFDVSFALNGTLGGSPGGQYAANIFGAVCGELLRCSNASPFIQIQTLAEVSGPSQPESLTQIVRFGSVPFVYGQAFDFTTYLVVNAVVYGAAGTTSQAFVDFLHTAELQPFAVYDSTGARDITATVTSTTSDWTYRTAVPEPATWATMIIGFGAVGSMVRSARRRKSSATA